jgi:hypothetical protein
MVALDLLWKDSAVAPLFRRHEAAAFDLIVAGVAVAAAVRTAEAAVDLGHSPLAGAADLR